MGLNYLTIFYIISLIVCLCGFYKYVYFLSIGYGFAVSGIGLALLVMSTLGIFDASLPYYIFFILYIIYGIRLSGFLLVREIKNASYRKTLKEATGNEIPMFVKFFIWIFTSILYVAQTSPVYFSLLNKTEANIFLWVGIVISVSGILLESVADKQKSEQKKENPDMVAMSGLYKMVRCPNYFGEILFWSGVIVASLPSLSGLGQWLCAVIGYICIVYIMFNGAQRLEKRQMARYGNNEIYNNYADKTPIIIPFLPIYHLNKKED